MREKWTDKIITLSISADELYRSFSCHVVFSNDKYSHIYQVILSSNKS